MKINTTFVAGLYAVKYDGQELDELERLLDEWMDIEKLSVFFEDNSTDLKYFELAKQKSKRRWLRLYAIRVDKGTFVITGGAIKLTHYMDERHHTRKELLKLELCSNYLKSQGVFDFDSFNELDL
jgi:hypothetical protein